MRNFLKRLFIGWYITLSIAEPLVYAARLKIDIDDYKIKAFLVHEQEQKDIPFLPNKNTFQKRGVVSLEGIMSSLALQGHHYDHVEIDSKRPLILKDCHIDQIFLSPSSQLFFTETNNFAKANLNVQKAQIQKNSHANIAQCLNGIEDFTNYGILDGSNGALISSHEMRNMGIIQNSIFLKHYLFQNHKEVMSEFLKCDIGILRNKGRIESQEIQGVIKELINHKNAVVRFDQGPLKISKNVQNFGLMTLDVLRGKCLFDNFDILHIQTVANNHMINHPSGEILSRHLHIKSDNKHFLNLGVMTVQNGYVENILTNDSSIYYFDNQNTLSIVGDCFHIERLLINFGKITGKNLETSNSFHNKEAGCIHLENLDSHQLLNDGKIDVKIAKIKTFLNNKEARCENLTANFLTNHRDSVLEATTLSSKEHIQNQGSIVSEQIDFHLLENHNSIKNNHLVLTGHVLNNTHAIEAPFLKAKIDELINSNIIKTRFGSFDIGRFHNTITGNFRSPLSTLTLSIQGVNDGQMSIKKICGDGVFTNNQDIQTEIIGIFFFKNQNNLKNKKKITLLESLKRLDNTGYMSAKDLTINGKDTVVYNSGDTHVSEMESYGSVINTKNWNSEKIVLFGSFINQEQGHFHVQSLYGEGIIFNTGFFRVKKCHFSSLENNGIIHPNIQKMSGKSFQNGFQGRVKGKRLLMDINAFDNLGYFSSKKLFLQGPGVNQGFLDVLTLNGKGNFVNEGECHANVLSLNTFINQENGVLSSQTAHVSTVVNQGKWYGTSLVQGNTFENSGFMKHQNLLFQKILNSGDLSATSMTMNTIENFPSGKVRTDTLDVSMNFQNDNVMTIEKFAYFSGFFKNRAILFLKSADFSKINKFQQNGEIFVKSGNIQLPPQGITNEGMWEISDSNILGGTFVNENILQGSKANFSSLSNNRTVRFEHLESSDFKNKEPGTFKGESFDGNFVNDGQMHIKRLKGSGTNNGDLTVDESIDSSAAMTNTKNLFFLGKITSQSWSVDNTGNIHLLSDDKSTLILKNGGHLKFFQQDGKTHVHHTKLLTIEGAWSDLMITSLDTLVLQKNMMIDSLVAKNSAIQNNSTFKSENIDVKDLDNSQIGVIVVENLDISKEFTNDGIATISEKMILGKSFQNHTTGKVYLKDADFSKITSFSQKGDLITKEGEIKLPTHVTNDGTWQVQGSKIYGGDFINNKTLKGLSAEIEHVVNTHGGTVDIVRFKGSILNNGEMNFSKFKGFGTNNGKLTLLKSIDPTSLITNNHDLIFLGTLTEQPWITYNKKGNIHLKKDDKYVTLRGGGDVALFQKNGKIHVSHTEDLILEGSWSDFILTSQNGSLVTIQSTFHTISLEAYGSNIQNKGILGKGFLTVKDLYNHPASKMMISHLNVLEGFKNQGRADILEKATFSKSFIHQGKADQDGILFFKNADFSKVIEFLQRGDIFSKNGEIVLPPQGITNEGIWEISDSNILGGTFLNENILQGSKANFSSLSNNHTVRLQHLESSDFKNKEPGTFKGDSFDGNFVNDGQMHIKRLKGSGTNNGDLIVDESIDSSAAMTNTKNIYFFGLLTQVPMKIQNSGTFFLSNKKKAFRGGGDITLFHKDGIDYLIASSSITLLGSWDQSDIAAGSVNLESHAIDTILRAQFIMPSKGVLLKNVKAFGDIRGNESFIFDNLQIEAGVLKTSHVLKGTYLTAPKIDVDKTGKVIAEKIEVKDMINEGEIRTKIFKGSGTNNGDLTIYESIDSPAAMTNRKNLFFLGKITSQGWSVNNTGDIHLNKSSIIFRGGGKMTFLERDAKVYVTHTEALTLEGVWSDFVMTSSAPLTIGGGFKNGSMTSPVIKNFKKTHLDTITMTGKNVFSENVTFRRLSLQGDSLHVLKRLEGVNLRLFVPTDIDAGAFLSSDVIEGPGEIRNQGDLHAKSLNTKLTNAKTARAQVEEITSFVTNHGDLKVNDLLGETKNHGNLTVLNKTKNQNLRNTHVLKLPSQGGDMTIENHEKGQVLFKDVQFQGGGKLHLEKKDHTYRISSSSPLIVFGTLTEKTEIKGHIYTPEGLDFSDLFIQGSLKTSGDMRGNHLSVDEFYIDKGNVNIVNELNVHNKLAIEKPAIMHVKNARLQTAIISQKGTFHGSGGQIALPKQTDNHGIMSFEKSTINGGTFINNEHLQIQSTDVNVEVRNQKNMILAPGQYKYPIINHSKATLLSDNFSINTVSLTSSYIKNFLSNNDSEIESSHDLFVPYDIDGRIRSQKNIHSMFYGGQHDINFYKELNKFFQKHTDQDFIDFYHFLQNHKQKYESTYPLKIEPMNIGFLTQNHHLNLQIIMGQAGKSNRNLLKWMIKNYYDLPREIYQIFQNFYNFLKQTNYTQKSHIPLRIKELEEKKTNFNTLKQSQQNLKYLIQSSNFSSRENVLALSKKIFSVPNDSTLYQILFQPFNRHFPQFPNDKFIPGLMMQSYLKGYPIERQIEDYKQNIFDEFQHKLSHLSLDNPYIYENQRQELKMYYWNKIVSSQIDSDVLMNLNQKWCAGEFICISGQVGQFDKNIELLYPLKLNLDLFEAKNIIFRTKFPLQIKADSGIEFLKTHFQGQDITLESERKISLVSSEIYAKNLTSKSKEFILTRTVKVPKPVNSSYVQHLGSNTSGDNIVYKTTHFTLDSKPSKMSILEDMNVRAQTATNEISHIRIGRNLVFQGHVVPVQNVKNVFTLKGCSSSDYVSQHDWVESYSSSSFWGGTRYGWRVHHVQKKGYALPIQTPDPLENGKTNLPAILIVGDHTYLSGLDVFSAINSAISSSDIDIKTKNLLIKATSTLSQQPSKALPMEGNSIVVDTKSVAEEWIDQEIVAIPSSHKGVISPLFEDDMLEHAVIQQTARTLGTLSFEGVPLMSLMDSMRKNGLAIQGKGSDTIAISAKDIQSLQDSFMVMVQQQIRNQIVSIPRLYFPKNFINNHIAPGDISVHQLQIKADNDVTLQNNRLIITGSGKIEAKNKLLRETEKTRHINHHYGHGGNESYRYQDELLAQQQQIICAGTLEIHGGKSNISIGADTIAGRYAQTSDKRVEERSVILERGGRDQYVDEGFWSDDVIVKEFKHQISLPCRSVATDQIQTLSPTILLQGSQRHGELGQLIGDVGSIVDIVPAITRDQFFESRDYSNPFKSESTSQNIMKETLTHPKLQTSSHGDLVIAGVKAHLVGPEIDTRYVIDQTKEMIINGAIFKESRSFESSASHMLGDASRTSYTQGEFVKPAMIHAQKMISTSKEPESSLTLRSVHMTSDLIVDKDTVTESTLLQKTDTRETSSGTGLKIPGLSAPITDPLSSLLQIHDIGSALSAANAVVGTGNLVMTGMATGFDHRDFLTGLVGRYTNLSIGSHEASSHVQQSQEVANTLKGDVLDVRAKEWQMQGEHTFDTVRLEVDHITSRPIQWAHEEEHTMNSDTFSFNPLTLNVGYAHSESQSHLKQSTYKPSTLVGRALETKVERMDLVGTDVTFKQGVGEIQELSMSSVTDKKSFIKNAMQVGLSVGLISLAAGNPLAITPSFGMDDTDHQEYLIQRGRSTFVIEDDTLLKIQSTSQAHEKEWSKNDSTSLSIAPITEAFNLYQGIQKARSLYADIQKKYEERLEQALPKNVITHAIATEEEFIKKNPSVRTTTYDRTKEQYKKTTKAAEAILKNIQNDYIVNKDWINDPKTVERISCQMNHTYQKARAQGFSPQQSWIVTSMVTHTDLVDQLKNTPQKANALVVQGIRFASQNLIAYINRVLTPMVAAGLISKNGIEIVKSKIHQDSGAQVLANPIPKEEGPKVLSQPMTDVRVRLKGFDGIPEELIGYAKILSYPKGQNQTSSWTLGFPIYQDPKEGMILMSKKECNEYRGNRYGKLDSLKDTERHHMPADSITPIPYRHGPAIHMDKNDHAMTSSYGRSKKAQQYRDELKKLVDLDKGRDAMAMEIKDIKSKFGSKYNTPIKEMLDYAKTLDHFKKKQ